MSTATDGRYSLEHGTRVATEVCELLGPACERIEVAGSIRRRRDTIKDVEIVCVPKLIEAPGTLFGSDRPVSAIDERLRELQREGCGLRLHPELPRNGQKYKRLQWHGSISVDLFIVTPPASWGAIFTIRTGPADFSEWLVTTRTIGGAMPTTMIQREGALQRIIGQGESRRYERIETPEEWDYFDALNLPHWPPEIRTVARLREHLHHEGRP